MNEQPIAISQYLAGIRQANPVILTLANYVTAGKVADALNAIGASPIMAVAPEEANEIVKICSAITINLGTIDHQQETMIDAILGANDHQRPVVLDPVAVGSSLYRRQISQRLLDHRLIDVIRANAGEIATLTNQSEQPHGIDSGIGGNKRQITELAQQCAQHYRCLVVLTGPIDVITDGHTTLQNQINCHQLAINVGSGDILSSLLAAFLVSNMPNKLDACFAATKFLTSIGQWAAKQSNGLGSWQVQFFDGLSNESLWKDVDNNDK